MFTVSNDMVEQIVVEEVKEEVKQKGEGDEDEEEADEPPPEDGEEAKAPSWNPKDFKWTITNGHSKNLPQLFRDYKGNQGSFEEKNWKTYQSASQSDAAVKALDEFCSKISDADNKMALYYQIIFNDQD